MCPKLLPLFHSNYEKVIFVFSVKVESSDVFTENKFLCFLLDMLTAELNRSRKLGCEFEMTVPLVGSGTGTDVQNTLANVLTANGLLSTARSYSHSRLAEPVELAVEYDSSIRGESLYSGITWHSVELKTNILNGLDDFERIVPKALSICSYMGARVNKSTGFHLHIGLPEVVQKPTVLKSLVNLFYRFEPVIYGLVAPSRSNNAYTMALDFDTVKQLQKCRAVSSFRTRLLNWNRKTGINLTHVFSGSYSSGPRIEFRYHQGTLAVEKARHWVRFILQMVEHGCMRSCHHSVKQVPNTRQGLEKLLVSCGFKVNSRVYSRVSPELRETGRFLIQRWKRFNGNISLRDSRSVTL